MASSRPNVEREVAIVATVIGGKVDQVRLELRRSIARGTLMTILRKAVALVDDREQAGEVDVACRYCQCTEHNACVDELSGEPCHWIDHDVCSATPCRMAHARTLMALAQRVLKGGA